MSDPKLEIDDRQVQELFSELRGKNIQKVMRRTLTIQGGRLRRATVKEFGNLYTKGKPNRKGRLTSLSVNGRKLKPASVRVFTKTKNPFATVVIRTKRGATDFRALFFELGTRKRKNRGQIKAGYYFKRAKDNNEQAILSQMENDAHRAIREMIRRQRRAARR